MNTTARTAFAAGIALACGAFTLTAMSAAPSEAPTPEPTAAVTPTYTLPPCEYEDSENCYWDAANMGNGQGTSFINLNGVTYYPEGK